MKGKLAALAGMGVGYVLGTRAGRERYEQIRGGAQRFWQDPRVATKRHQAANVAKDQATAAKDVVAEKVGEKVGEKVHKSHDETQSMPTGDLPDAPGWQV